MVEHAMSDGDSFLAAELERLRALPLRSKTDVKSWRVEAAALEKQLTTRFPGLDFPHEIWHYLADADIRAREPDYGVAQERVVADYIASIRAGHPTI